MEHLADADAVLKAEGWADGLAADDVGWAADRGAAAADGRPVDHLVNTDAGRWAVDGLAADTVDRWTASWLAAATDGWLVECLADDCAE